MFFFVRYFSAESSKVRFVLACLVKNICSRGSLSTMKLVTLSTSIFGFHISHLYGWTSKKLGLGGPHLVSIFGFHITTTHYKLVWLETPPDLGSMVGLVPPTINWSGWVQHLRPPYHPQKSTGLGGLLPPINRSRRTLWLDYHYLDPPTNLGLGGLTTLGTYVLLPPMSGHVLPRSACATG